ncbi:MAG: hypothetical protein OXF56_22770, partial [Rhodobacteraceae bacterium]|nr:hypothetical protein [Paracoccaceae bacterium]
DNRVKPACRQKNRTDSPWGDSNQANDLVTRTRIRGLQNQVLAAMLLAAHGTTQKTPIRQQNQQRASGPSGNGPSTGKG